METEPPAERLHRRLGTEVDHEAAAPGDAGGGHPDTALSRWLPESQAGRARDWAGAIRADPGRAGVIALAVVGVIAVLVTVFSLMRDSTPPVTSAKLPPVQMVSSASPKPAAADGPIVVSVAGLVHKPGLVTLTPGARIADALEAAGGPLDGADLMGLNIARRVADGEQIIVGLAPPAGEPATMGSSVIGDAPSVGEGASVSKESLSAPGDLVDLNTASVEQLDTLPGVGPVTAGAIVAWRDANGRFSSVEQLAEVDGIGEARLAKLRDMVRV